MQSSCLVPASSPASTRLPMHQHLQHSGQQIMHSRAQRRRLQVWAQQPQAPPPRRSGFPSLPGLLRPSNNGNNSSFGPSTSYSGGSNGSSSSNGGPTQQWQAQQQQQQQQQQQSNYPPPQTQTGSNGGGGGPPPPKGPLQEFLSSYAKALIAAAFVAGLGLGVYFDSEVVLSPNNISSTEIIDRSTPNADVCMAYGYSASVFDMKLFVTYNPFNVYVTQPAIRSGCVLRRSNVGVLEREKVVSSHDVDVCKQRMNTFAFTGDLKNEPEVACVYHSEEAENQYLRMTKDLMGGKGTPLATGNGAAGEGGGV